MQGLSLASLLRAARGVGLGLVECSSAEAGSLYAWTTPAGEVLYIGKGKPARLRQEDAWAGEEFARWRSGWGSRRW